MEYMTRIEVARLLKIKLRTVDLMIRRGDLEAVKLSKKIVRITKESYDALSQRTL